MISNLTHLRDWVLTRVVKLISSQEYLTLQIDITNLCNLRCAHCYHPHHNNTGAIDLDQWFDVLDQYESLLNKLYLKPSIVICGGEPLVSDKFSPIVSYIKNKWNSVSISVLTNGTRINEKNISFIKDNDIDIQISLDGHNEFSHDLVRGKGSFRKTLEGISLALDSDISVNLLSILSRRTARNIDGFFNLASSLGVYSINFTRLIPEGHGQKLVDSNSDASLYGHDLKEAMENIIASSKKYKVTTNTNKPLYCLIDESLGSNNMFGFQGLVIDYKGNLKVSSRTNVKLGNVLEEGLENIFFNNPTLKKLRNGKKNECHGCAYYNKCGGDRNMSFASTGSYLEKDPGCWVNLQG